MQKSELKSAFFRLGLSDQQTEIYLALAELGPSTSGPLIVRTGFHRNVVYTALEHLIASRYVVETQVKGKKRFVVADPEVITGEFAAKANTAKEVVREIQLIAARMPQEVTVHEGNDEYLALLTGLVRSLPKGGIKYVLGTGGREFMLVTMRSIWKKYHKVVKEQGIQIRMIAYESQRSAIAHDVDKEAMYDVRYLPDEIENPAGVHIYPEASTTLNIIYSTEGRPVTAIRIKNDELAHGQLNLFKNLWKMARP